MNFSVRITPTAKAKILAQARYIAVDCNSPLNAQRWLHRIFDSADTLATLPERCTPAAEDKFRDYTIRRLLVGDYLLLFTVVEADKTVWVIGLRHGSQLPSGESLPDAVPAGDEPES